LKFKLLFPVLILVFGCGKPDQPISTDYSDIKTESSLLSCKSLRLPRDLKLNGNLLYKIPKCLSNKTESGEETLAGTVSMVETLSIEGLDSLTDLLKANPQGTKDYPIIRSFLTITERGVVKDGVISEDLVTDRFGFFQEFSSKMNPYWLVNLLVEMADNGRAKKLLDMLFPMVEEVNIKNLMALNRAMLVDEKFQGATLKLVNGILDKKEIYDPLKDLMTLEKSLPLPKQLGEDCLTEWLDPVPRGEKGECLENVDMDDFKGVTAITAADKYETLLDDLKDEKVRKLAKMVSQVSESFLTLDSKERLAALKKMSVGGKQALNTQDGFVRNMVSLVDFFLGEEGKESKVKISDLDFIMDGLLESIEVTGPDAVKALNQKAASAKLHYQVEQLILNGGPFPSCGNLSLPALKDLDLNNQKVFFQALATYFMPHEKCPHNLSPLAANYFESISKKIGTGPDCMGPDGNYYDESCLDQKHLELVAKDLKEFDYKDWKNFESIDQISFKELVLDVLIEAKNKLKDDPYHLHWPHFAEGSVPPKIINYIINKVADLGMLTPEKVAKLDLELEKDPVTKGILRNDFIENLITKKIDDLKIVSENFNGLFLGNEVADKKALELLSGVYFEGPLEKFISSNLFTGKVDPEITNSFTDDNFRVYELFGRIREKGVFINNSRLFVDDTTVSYKFLGYKNRSVSYEFKEDASGKFVFDTIAFDKEPIQSQDLFGPNFIRFNKILLEDTLKGINLKNGKGDEFDYWAKNILYDELNKYSHWEKKFQVNKDVLAINSKYFETTPYSALQSRMLALFYSKNFLMADAISPDEEEGIEFNSSRTKRFAPINLSYLNLVNPSKESWNYYVKLFPDALKGEGRLQTFSEIHQNIMNWDEDSYNKILWKELPSDKRRKRELHLAYFSPLGQEVIKTYNALNLFTTNRKLKYMPLFGVEKECSLANKRASKCPLTFNSFSNLKNNVSHALLRKLCPYIGNSDVGFSPEFLSKIEKSLMIKILDPSFVKVCENPINLFKNLDDRLPTWYHETVLDNLISLGQNPKLKKGFSHLGASIKYFKLKERFKDSPESFTRELINSKGFLPAKYLKYYVRQTRDHRGFLTIFPGIVNTYQNYLFNLSMGLDRDNRIDDALARFGADVKVHQDLTTGIIQDFLINHLIKRQKKFENRDAAAIELIFEILHNIDDDQIKALTGLVAYPQDIESLSNFTGTYSIFLEFLMNQIPPGQFWKQPGAIALKQLMRQENLRALTDIMGAFDADEVFRTLKVLQKAIIDLGEPGESVEILRVVRNFLKDHFLSFHEKEQEGMVFRFEGLLRAIYEEVFFNLSNEDLNKIFSVIVKDGLIDFSGRPAKSMLGEMEALNYFALKNTHNILKVYQGHFENREMIKTGDNEYFQNLVKGLLAPFKLPGAIMGSKIMANLLEDENLGTWDSLLKPLLFEDKYQDLVLDVLGRLNEVTLSDIDKGLLESNILIPSTHHSLKFLRDAMIWRPDASKDVKYGVDSFFRLSEPGSILWEGNYSLLRNWLTQAVGTK